MKIFSTNPFSKFNKSAKLYFKKRNGGGGFVLYLTDFLRHLSKTHALNFKNLLHSIIARRDKREQNTKNPVIARRVSETNATKQSTSTTFELCVNLLLYANLRLDLLIRFWVIAIHNLLDSRVLDGCFTSFANPMDCFGESKIRLAMTTHFNSHTTHKGIKMIV
ncbi:hypothetical protein [Helicobacter sp. 23-1045]